MYRYTIPSFCAITMNLQQVTLQGLTEEGEEETFEGFIRVKHQFERCLPACVRSLCLCCTRNFFFTS